MHKIFNSWLVCGFLAQLPKLDLGHSSIIVGLREAWINLNGPIKILYGCFVVFDVLIDESSLFVNQSVLANELYNFCQTLESLSKFVVFMLHQTQVVYCWNMFGIDFQGFLEHPDCIIIILSMFVGESLTMIKLRVCRHDLYGFVEVCMCLINLFECQVGVSTVK